ncbi:MAG: hypothetical protein QF773_09645, partial [Lentisphaeria bacterium]|nr:hypothetical protein [Lentisphaeria bacterium]
PIIMGLILLWKPRTLVNQDLLMVVILFYYLEVLQVEGEMTATSVSEQRLRVRNSILTEAQLN